MAFQRPHTCACCGERAHRDAAEPCRTCGWQRDVAQEAEADLVASPNRVALREARAAHAAYLQLPASLRDSLAFDTMCLRTSGERQYRARHLPTGLLMLGTPIAPSDQTHAFQHAETRRLACELANRVLGSEK